jgi:formate/nitrite transporter
LNFDALLPQETALKAEESGAAKAKRDAVTLLLLAILAGAFVGFGALFANLVGVGSGDALPFGITRLISGLAFSLGLIMVVVCGAELFTGDVLMTIAWASKRIDANALARAWAIVFFGNCIGAAGTATLVFISGHLDLDGGRVGSAALALALGKTSLPLWHAFWLGALCNVLVCLAVWGSLAARSVTDKAVIVALPVAAFVAAGFEHSIANIYTVTLGLLIRWFGDPALSASIDPDRLALLNPGRFAISLFLVTTGNLAGGAVLVALVYWLAFLRPRVRQ